MPSPKLKLRESKPPLLFEGWIIPDTEVPVVDNGYDLEGEILALG